MKGWLETLTTEAFLRGLSPALLPFLMSAPARKVARAQLKRIYVLGESGDMAGEYVLDPDCPIDYNDFLKVLPEDGIGDRESLFVGEYVFTAFQSGSFVFVLLSRGQLSSEDFDWTALLLTAADSHLAAASGKTLPVRASEAKAPVPADKALAEREARVKAHEGELVKLEARLNADEANLKGRAEEVERQKQRLVALSDYLSQVRQSVTAGVGKAAKSLELAEHIAAGSRATVQEDQRKEISAARQTLEAERKALLAARGDLEAKYRDAAERAKTLEKDLEASAAALATERALAATREAEAQRTRVEIETRVQELSQRFAAMAKERLVASHRPAEPTDAAKQAIEMEKASLGKERKFLQRRAIEVLEREEQVRDREAKTQERERALTERERALAAREAEVARIETTAPSAPAPAAPVQPDVDAARKDIERRVKIIQQKALELLDREEKLRKRAAELEAMESRLAGGVPAK
ncbi:MAG: hypothetical protein A3K68_01980 [Euryarchaeota archaeon RBG_16_68_13]|nr:MAG: hypothetical protein A3K68_01980 [Euryarchaeota archaeon RBG_16_68_13]